MKIAFLGLGIMGSRMAERLIRAGFELTVWNRTPGKAEALKKLGATEATSPKEAAAAADAAITMLADPASVEEVVFKRRSAGGINEGEPLHRHDDRLSGNVAKAGGRMRRAGHRFPGRTGDRQQTGGGRR
ncbi:MAG: NAD(P)-binding domain-containing protein [Candidatus Manganitrophus sp.]|nr:NAD(P)-binding domain-containing protein [Candidatus Manganitrophus sp.]